MGNKKEKNKFNFKEKKENTINSLFEVEKFLSDLKKAKTGIAIHKIINRHQKF